MFNPEFKEEAVDNLLVTFFEEGFMGSIRPPSTEEEKKKLRQAVQTCLQYYFGTVEKGYLQVLEETKKSWTEAKIKEFTLSDLTLERLKDPAELKKINEEHPVLQTYLHYSDDLIREVFSIAGDLTERREWEQAVAVVVFLIYLNPYIAEFWEGLGQCWEQASQWDTAEFAYERAIQCAPANPEFYRSACQCLLEQKNYPRAEEILNEGLAYLSEQPSDPNITEATELLTAALAYVNDLAGRRM